MATGPMGSGFLGYLDDQFRRIHTGAVPLVDGIREILRKLDERLRDGEAEAIEFFAHLGKLVVDLQFADEPVGPEWSEEFAKLITQSVLSATRPGLEGPRNVFLQLRQDTEDLASEIRELERFQWQITSTTPPPNSSLTIGVARKPKSSISGDFIDIFGDGDWTWILLGDAAGHGLRAGFYANTVFPVLRMCLRRASLPDSLREANREIHFHKPDSRDHVAAHVAAWNRMERKFQIVNAGMWNADAIVVKDASARRVETTGSHLGLLPADLTSWQVETLTMAPGDLAIFVSDGITEQPGPAGDEYGMVRLVDFIGRNSSLPPQEFASHILREATPQGDQQAGDDQTVLVVRFD